MKDSADGDVELPAPRQARSPEPQFNEPWPVMRSPGGCAGVNWPHSSLSLPRAVNSSRLHTSASRLGVTAASAAARQLGSMLSSGTRLTASIICDAVRMMGKNAGMVFTLCVMGRCFNARTEFRVASIPSVSHPAPRPYDCPNHCNIGLSLFERCPLYPRKRTFVGASTSRWLFRQQMRESLFARFGCLCHAFKKDRRAIYSHPTA
jgi:hypothetical protein